MVLDDKKEKLCALAQRERCFSVFCFLFFHLFLFLRRRQVQCTPVPWPLLGVCVPTTQDALDHMKTLLRRELRSWYSIPRKPFPRFALTNLGPHTKDEGGHSFEASFAPSGVKGEGVGQRVKEERWVDKRK